VQSRGARAAGGLATGGGLCCGRQREARRGRRGAPDVGRRPSPGARRRAWRAPRRRTPCAGAALRKPLLCGRAVRRPRRRSAPQAAALWTSCAAAAQAQRSASRCSVDELCGGRADAAVRRAERRARRAVGEQAALDPAGARGGGRQAGQRARLHPVLPAGLPHAGAPRAPCPARARGLPYYVLCLEVFVRLWLTVVYDMTIIKHDHDQTGKNAVHEVSHS